MLHGFPISNLADQDHVRRLAQGILQRDLVGLGIDADFALRHQAIAMVVYEFDRVLDGNDMTMRVTVAVIHHRSQRGRFTGTGSTDKNDQASLGHGDILQNRRQVQFFETRNIGIDDPQYHAAAAALHEGIDTKAGNAGQRDGKITFLFFLEFGNLLVVHDRTRQHLRVIRRQVLLRDHGDLAVDFHGRRRARGDK